MNNNFRKEEILDLREDPQLNFNTRKDVRLRVIVLEFLPLFILIWFAASSQLILEELLIAAYALVHLLFGWYIFKAKDYSLKNTLTVILCSILEVAIAFSLLLKVNSYPFASTISLISSILALLMVMYLMYRFVRLKENRLEYRFSLKLASRLVLFLIIGLMISFL